MIINGIAYDTDTATFTSDGQAATQDDFAVGQVVLIIGTIDDDNTNAVASSVEFDANDVSGNTWYATNSMFGPSQKVVRTTTDGASWDDITGNLPDIPTHTIAVQPGGSHNLFLGTDIGVFVSHNQGGVWQDVTVPPFPNTVVENLAFQSDIALYAFTFGRGVWRGVPQYFSGL